MREIKFRAWNTIVRRMSATVAINGFPPDTQWQNLIIMQFTGLRDKHGKEIYEGDIVSVPEGYCGDYFYPSVKAIVKYDAPEFMLVGSKDKYGIVHQDFAWDELEIIGNIYENPELTDREGGRGWTHQLNHQKHR